MSMTSTGHPSTMELAERIRLEATLMRRRRTAQTIPVLARDGDGDHTFPASYIERLMWFLHHEYPGRSTFITLGALRLRGPLDLSMLEQALNAMLDRHDVLRSVYRHEGDQVVRVERAHAPLSIPVREVTDDEESAAAAAVIDEPFDLENGPLVRLHLLRINRSDHLAVLVLHHIISDGRSMELFFQELSTLYLAIGAGVDSVLPPLTVQYADVAMWQRERLSPAVRQEMTAYWTRRMAGHQLLRLPTDASRLPEPSSAGLTHGLKLSDELVAGLRTFASTHRSTLFMVTLAAVFPLLGWYSGQNDILLATPVSWRDRPETDALMGAFINYVLLRADLSDNPTFTELAATVRESTAQDLHHHELPLDDVIVALGYEPSHGRDALLRVLFTEEANPSVPLPESGPLTGELVEPPWHHALRDFTVRFTAAADGTYVIFTYRTDAFTAERIAAIAEDYRDVLTRVMSEPDRRVHESDGPFGVRLRVPPVAPLPLPTARGAA